MSTAIVWQRCPMSLREARSTPFPAAWRDILDAEVPPYARLQPAARARFEEHVKRFVLTKAFSADAGVPLDDRVRLLVGAAAAMLALNIPGESFARLRHVHVYRGTCRGGLPTVLGEATGPHKVAMSYEALCEAFQISDDGSHVAMHELAHVLDAQFMGSDGVPRRLPGSSPTHRWVEVLERELAGLREAIRRGAPTILDPYAATSRVELFAVATEAFFEHPARLLDGHPDLYALLVECYGQDPASALGEPPGQAGRP